MAESGISVCLFADETIELGRFDERKAPGRAGTSTSILLGPKRTKNNIDFDFQFDGKITEIIET